MFLKQTSNCHGAPDSSNILEVTEVFCSNNNNNNNNNNYSITISKQREPVFRKETQICLVVRLNAITPSHTVASVAAVSLSLLVDE